MMTGRGSSFSLVAPVALAVGVFATSCGGPSPQGPGGHVSPPPEVGDAAPEFTLRAADGSEVTLQGLTTGRPALFYFSMGPG